MSNTDGAVPDGNQDAVELALVDEAGLSEALVANSLVAVHFHDPNSASCRDYSRTFLGVADQLPDALFVTANMDLCPWSVDQFEIGSTPSTALFKDGKLVTQPYAGILTADVLASYVRKHLLQ